MARFVTLLAGLTASLLSGHVVTATSPSLTHQNPAVVAGVDPLAEYMSLRDNVTNFLPARRVPPPVSRRDGPASIFRRQAEEPGEGALLCPTGKCPDGSCCGASGVCGYGPELCGTGCQSNCDATAMCGPLSEGGALKCGMDLCCSTGGWCGTTENHCIGPNKWSLCLEGYGKCEMIRPKTCGEGSGSADAISIGYYQASNVRNRICNRISPSQIKTEDYTHLYFAFASIDPTNFQIVPWEDADIPLMREFTALKTEGLQTWIAVGGFDFSDPGRPTHTTWSDLCADPAKRAMFIASAKTFMDEYGFQGIDLDWEYPGDPGRGGKREDIENFVHLLREMRAAYGNAYGISLTLAPDYWYLRWFDAEGLEPYVDHLGFMAYDLHGFWDADVDTLGSIVRGQADVREIYNNTIPLAYADLDFSKIVFGVAWYGRGYTLADPTCNTLGCGFKGPSKPGKCTNSAGVMSLVEIQGLIKEKNLEPRLLEGAMMKELVWDDQWIGYDDEETVEMKKRFASNYCFGGTMAWSVDFNSGTGDTDEPPVSTDGRCGPEHGGAVCEDSGFGSCCSVAGYCGSTDAHCGSGCISGECIKGGVTTDGSCGVGAHDAICKGWSSGECCSSAGWCGDSDAHCGKGCQNGPCDDRPPVEVGDPNEYYDYRDVRWENRQRCIIYDPRDEASLFHCLDACKPQIEAAKEEGRTVSYGCIGFWPLDEPIPWATDPGTGQRATPGKCTCDNPLLNEIGETFVEMVAIIGQVGCFMLMSTIKLVAELGLSFVPGVGRPVTRALGMAIDTAKLIDYVYPEDEDPEGAFDFWLSPCGGTDLVPDDIKRVYGILNSVVDGVTGWKPPSKINKGSGKKGDEGNPKDRPKVTPTPTRTSPTTTGACKMKRANPARTSGNTIASSECHNGMTTTHAYTITSLSYAANAQATQVQAECRPEWTQACYHYSSVISNNPQWATLSCPSEAATKSRVRLKPKATATWASQHRGSGWKDAVHRVEPDCERDEYPPAYLLSTSDTAYIQSGKDATGQAVRWLPASQNGGAASMWAKMCFKVPLMAMTDGEMYDAAENKNFGLMQNVVAPTLTEYQVGITVAHRPEFTIAAWNHITPQSQSNDDGLSGNPCWPKNIAPGDPGFTLLTFDPYYNGQKPPYNYAAAYVSGKNGVKRDLGPNDSAMDVYFNTTLVDEGV